MTEEQVLLMHFFQLIKLLPINFYVVPPMHLQFVYHPSLCTIEWCHYSKYMYTGPISHLRKKQRMQLSRSYASMKLKTIGSGPSPENFLATGQCFKCTVSCVTAA